MNFPEGEHKMSLESLSALKQLTQVRQQGQDIQEQNLEKVNNQVQETGKSEAQRIDQLNLETAKAQYEVELHAAKVETLQKKMERDSLATTLSTGIAIGVAVLSTGDFLINTFKDLSGDRNLGDQSQRQRTEGLDPNSSRTVTVRRDGTDATDNFTFGSNNNFSQTVYLTSRGGDGSVTGDVRAATITKDDIKNILRERGAIDDNGNLTDLGRQALADILENRGITNTSGNINFDSLDIGVQDMLMSSNSSVREAFRDLFHEKSHTILRSEVDNYLASVENSLPSEMNMENVRNNIEALGLDGGVSFGQGLQLTWNNLVTLADTNIPFIQAMLAAQERERQTAEELQAAKEKLAAAQKKLDELKQILINVGGDGLGN
jgi:conjugal transfer/entry exclusion protein